MTSVLVLDGRKVLLAAGPSLNDMRFPIGGSAMVELGYPLCEIPDAVMAPRERIVLQ